MTDNIIRFPVERTRKPATANPLSTWFDAYLAFWNGLAGAEKEGKAAESK